MADERSPVEQAEAQLDARAAERSRSRRAATAELAAAGDYRGALNLVIGKGIAGEAAKKARGNPDHVGVIYRNLITALELFAAQIPAYKPTDGGQR